MQDLQNIHLNKYNVVCGVLYVTFSFGHCVVCSSSIYGFWLPPFGIFKLFFLHIPLSIVLVKLSLIYNPSFNHVLENKLTNP